MPSTLRSFHVTPELKGQPHTGVLLEILFHFSVETLRVGWECKNC